MTSHLIDEVLALDAGGLTRALTFEEQKRIRAIILSHRHYDHVRDLPALGLAIRDTGVTVEVYAIQDTVDFVSSKLLDGSLYPDFLNGPSAENPVFRLNTVEPYRDFKVLDYTVVAVPLPHAVPSAGFHVSSGNASLFYTGDTGKGVAEAWRHVSPDVLLAEVTYGNENEAVAISAGHLTPAFLGEALTRFAAERGYVPRVIVSHVSPVWEGAIRDELKAVSEQIGVEIVVSHADMTVKL